MPGIVFAGTPEFARESLRALIEAGNVPALVLTQPDRPAGRGKKLAPSPVKQLALEHELPLLQPQNLRDAAIKDDLRRFQPDIIIVAAYGILFPQDVLDIPVCGCLNVHASILPRWRGAAPIQSAILAGDPTTGISLMRMEAGLDSGPVYASRSLVIGERETAGELQQRLAVLGGEMLNAELADILAGERLPTSQDEGAVTYAAKVRSSDAAIDWQQSAEHLARLVRAYNPAPGAYFDFHGERIKCWVAEALSAGQSTAGEIVGAGRDGIDIACADGTLRMLQLQRPGRNRISAREFAEQLAPSGGDGG